MADAVIDLLRILDAETGTSAEGWWYEPYAGSEGDPGTWFLDDCGDYIVTVEHDLRAGRGWLWEVVYSPDGPLCAHRKIANGTADLAMQGMAMAADAYSNALENARKVTNAAP